MVSGAEAVAVVSAPAQRGRLARTPLNGLEVAMEVVRRQVSTRTTVWLLTMGAQLAERVRDPSSAGSWGFGRSMVLEIQLPVHSIDGPLASVFELQSPLAELELVLRSSASVAPRLARVTRSVGSTAPMQSDGHLITGGTGGLGLLTGRWLGQRGVYNPP